MLISTAYAQGLGGMFDSSSAMIQFLPLVLRDLTCLYASLLQRRDRFSG